MLKCTHTRLLYRATLAETIKGDAFTNRLFQIYLLHGGPKAKQALQLGIHRSDYMLDESSQRLLQVELNTMASSFGCLSARVTQLHHFLLEHKQALLVHVDAKFAAGSYCYVFTLFSS